MRVAFVINSLTGGGAERVLSTLLSHFAVAPALLGDAELHLVLLDREAEQYAVPAGVHRHQLDCRGRFVSAVRGLSHLFRRIRPDVTVSFLTRANCASVIAARMLGHRCVVSERTNTTEHLAGGVGAHLGRTLVRVLYPRADRVIAVSEGVRQTLVGGYGVAAGRVSTIHNPYDLDGIRRQATEPAPIALPDRYTVAVGRLVPAKRHDDLIRAFARAGTEGDLVILGEGEERACLERLSASLGLAARVHLPGHVARPFPVIAGASIYASASSYEGFPNATAEAMALGRPVVSTACRYGPEELLEGAAPEPGRLSEGRCGLLVPVGEVGTLAAGLKRMSAPDFARAIGERARLRMEQLGVAAVSARYAAVIAGRDIPPKPAPDAAAHELQPELLRT